ncbi:hypothetical protein EI427_15555 [Flammeovirga pectinis]|uniref:NRDE family protein n=1 Tax=Flammeovirga pectinis TaxID=2494373 RepID=A0A3Q9FPS9_9BACT|nr:NRDE family protein [Flammeovirga pectinis]AZQ63586.1 hypothetical protein EI427_15555 [Flammeovirga pectinis]
MCTLSYIPINNLEYIFTSNRDERKSRASAFAPQLHEKNGIKFIAPIDGEALGTWLAASENGRIVCLLNGGFKRHIPTPPYKHSRGKVVLDATLSNDINTYLDTYNFSNIEPFTLIVIDQKEGVEITQFVWDGIEGHKTGLDAKVPHIWSSSTLYDTIQSEQRKERFLNWLNKSDRLSKEILDVHELVDRGDNEAFGLSMQRLEYCTVSTTQLKVSDSTVSMHYHDRLIQEKDNVSLPLIVLKHES